MFCERCGSKNPDGSAFCENCGNPFQNPYNNGVPVINNSGMNANTVQKVPRKPISKLTIAIIIEVVALVAVIYSMYSHEKEYYSAQKTSERFFVAMANGDWDEAYDMLDIKEGVFLNKKNFKTAGEINSRGIVSDYEVEAKGGEKNGKTKYYNVNYTKKSGATATEYLTLKKSKDKKYNLFETWKVSYSNLVMNEYMINVPEGAKVEFDGVTLDDSYIYSEFSLLSDGIETYCIQELFYGMHNIKVTMDGMDSIEEVVRVDSMNYSYNLYEMKLSDKMVSEIEESAVSNMKTIYEAAMNDKSFSSIKNLFTTDKDKLDDIEDDYEYMAEHFNSEYFSPYYIEFENVYLDFQNQYNYCVELEFDYSAEYYSYNNKTDVSEGSKTIFIYFINENGTWVQTNLGCSNIY